MANDVGLPALVHRLNAVQTAISGDLRPMAHAVGKGARVEAKQVAASVSGGDGVLSHMGRRGARLGMRYDVEGEGRQVIIRLVPAGPWMLTQKGAKAHEIGAPRSRGRNRGPRFVYASSYGHPMRGPIMHEGSKGKGAVARAMTAMKKRAPVDAHEAFLQSLRKAMG